MFSCCNFLLQKDSNEQDNNCAEVQNDDSFDDNYDSFIAEISNDDSDNDIVYDDSSANKERAGASAKEPISRRCLNLANFHCMLFIQTLQSFDRACFL